MKPQQAKKVGGAVSILPEFSPLDALWSGARPAYPSEQSARWAIRQHRKALVESSALALSRGRILIHPERFAKVIEAEAIKAMQRREGASSA